jgi:hypothetical protein
MQLRTAAGDPLGASGRAMLIRLTPPTPVASMVVQGDTHMMNQQVTKRFAVVLVSADSDGNWASECTGRAFGSRQDAQDAIDADPTTKPDSEGQACRVEIVEVDEDGWAGGRKIAPAIDEVA